MSSTASNTSRQDRSGASGKGADMMDKAGQQFDKVIDGAESTVQKVAEQGREVGERVQEFAGNVKSAIDKSAREQPMTTIAIAAAVGFVLGALWKS